MYKSIFQLVKELPLNLQLQIWNKDTKGWEILKRTESKTGDRKVRSLCRLKLSLRERDTETNYLREVSNTPLNLYTQVREFLASENTVRRQTTSGYGSLETKYIKTIFSIPSWRSTDLDFYTPLKQEELGFLSTESRQRISKYKSSNLQ